MLGLELSTVMFLIQNKCKDYKDHNLTKKDNKNPE